MNTNLTEQQIIDAVNVAQEVHNTQLTGLSGKTINGLSPVADFRDDPTGLQIGVFDGGQKGVHVSAAGTYAGGKDHVETAKDLAADLSGGQLQKDTQAFKDALDYAIERANGRQITFSGFSLGNPIAGALAEEATRKGANASLVGIDGPGAIGILDNPNDIQISPNNVVTLTQQHSPVAHFVEHLPGLTLEMPTDFSVYGITNARPTTYDPNAVPHGNTYGGWAYHAIDPMVAAINQYGLSQAVEIDPISTSFLGSLSNTDFAYDLAKDVLEMASRFDDGVSPPSYSEGDLRGAYDDGAGFSVNGRAIDEAVNNAFGSFEALSLNPDILGMVSGQAIGPTLDVNGKSITASNPSLMHKDDALSLMGSKAYSNTLDPNHNLAISGYVVSLMQWLRGQYP
ncbi:hypothetical protein [Terasakiella sp. SH-1]|uniref:hypothetical protein n=1 Tax=Terasakiella sp. SH-1 TaxID=2560057 RepID=UPI0010742015|nr:hypothetical protein [Terasakiella sp. SH-1]